MTLTARGLRRTLHGLLLPLLLLPTVLDGQTKQPAKDTPAVPQAAVTVDHQTLFAVRGILSFSAAARADAISHRISGLSKDATFKPGALATVDTENTTDIMANDLVVMSVTDQDARGTGFSRQALARNYTDQIRTALVALRTEHHPKRLLLGALYAVIATVILIALLRVLGIIFRKSYKTLHSWRGTRIRSLRIQKFELLPAHRITSFAIGMAKLLRLAVTTVLLYFYASIVLSLFPWTRGYAQILVGYILAPLRLVGDAIITYLPNVFFIVVISLVSFYVVKFIKVIFTELERQTITIPGFYPEWARPTYKIVRFLAISLTLIVVFPYLPGSESPAFRGVSIFLGVLFSFGSTSAVANIVAGVILTYMRPFKIGDRVKIADTMGDIIERTLLVTRVRTIKNVEITIANSMVLGSHIINFSSSAQLGGLILHTAVTIGYDAPWRTVHKLLLDAARATENILPQPEPFVLQTALSDFYVQYELNAFTDQPSQMARIYSGLHQNIQDKFNEAGVEIMSPHYASVRDGNKTAIPDDYLPKSYSAPSFRVGVFDALLNRPKSEPPR